MDEVLELVASVDIESFPPIATLSKAPTGIAVLGFSQLLTRLRSWNFFLEDLQSVRVLMVMRVQKIWKNVIVERLSGQSASAEKKQHAFTL